MLKRRSGTVAALGTAQTLAWASTYYLPAILAAPMARDLGVSTPTVFAAFSVALIVRAASIVGSCRRTRLMHRQPVHTSAPGALPRWLRDATGEVQEP